MFVVIYEINLAVMLLAVIVKLASCEKWHGGRGAEIWLGYTPFENPQI